MGKNLPTYTIEVSRFFVENFPELPRALMGLISTIPSVQTVANAVHSLQYPRYIQMECAKCEIIMLLR